MSHKKKRKERNHFFFIYKMVPKSDEVYVSLARIKDIYFRSNFCIVASITLSFGFY